MAIGFAHGSIIAEELATVVIGGLFTSTFLTLIVIPVLYSLVDGGKDGFARRFGGGGADEPPASTRQCPIPPRSRPRGRQGAEAKAPSWSSYRTRRSGIDPG